MESLFGAASLDLTNRAKEPLMYSNQITADMAAAHNRDLVAAADARRLSRDVRRGERHATPTRRVRRSWTRSRTQPAHI
jgi:hypothetical protein